MEVLVPVGQNSATIQVLDANGADITFSCSLVAESSDPSIIQIGNPDATTPNVIPFTALEPGKSAQVSYTATNSEGNVTQADTLDVQITSPASMTIVYGTTLPVPPPATTATKSGKK